MLVLLSNLSPNIPLLAHVMQFIDFFCIGALFFGATLYNTLRMWAGQKSKDCMGHSNCVESYVNYSSS